MNRITGDPDLDKQPHAPVLAPTNSPINFHRIEHAISTLAKVGEVALLDPQIPMRNPYVLAIPLKLAFDCLLGSYRLHESGRHHTAGTSQIAASSFLDHVCTSGGSNRNDNERIALRAIFSTVKILRTALESYPTFHGQGGELKTAFEKLNEAALEVLKIAKALRISTETAT